MFSKSSHHRMHSIPPLFIILLDVAPRVCNVSSDAFQAMLSKIKGLWGVGVMH